MTSLAKASAELSSTSQCLHGISCLAPGGFAAKGLFGKQTLTTCPICLHTLFIIYMRFTMVHAHIIFIFYNHLLKLLHSGALHFPSISLRWVCPLSENMYVFQNAFRFFQRQGATPCSLIQVTGAIPENREKVY